MIGFIVAGLIIGSLARLIKPGMQHLSLVATLLLGLAGSVIGGLAAPRRDAAAPDADHPSRSNGDHR